MVSRARGPPRTHRVSKSIASPHSRTVRASRAPVLRGDSASFSGNSPRLDLSPSAHFLHDVLMPAPRRTDTLAARRRPLRQLPVHGDRHLLERITPSISARSRRRTRPFRGILRCRCGSVPATNRSRRRSERVSVASHLGIKIADYDAADPHVHPGLRGDARRGGCGPSRARAHDPRPRRRHRRAGGALPRVRADAARVRRHRRRSGDARPGREPAWRPGHHSRPASFLRAPLPRCDAAVASFSLHHIRTRAAKAALYRRVHAALGSRGLFISVDCQPAGDAAVSRPQRDAWLAHLRRSYTRARAGALLDARAGEDCMCPSTESSS